MDDFRDESDTPPLIEDDLEALQSFARRKLSTVPAPAGSAKASSQADGWNIRNWGNFYDQSPEFDNH